MGRGPGWTRLVQAIFCRTIHGGPGLMVVWNTGLAAERARHNLKLNKKRRPAARAASSKLQAPSATKKTQLKDIVRLER